jgi:hypothetical protein
MAQLIYDDQHQWIFAFFHNEHSNNNNNKKTKCTTNDGNKRINLTKNCNPTGQGKESRIDR